MYCEYLWVGFVLRLCVTQCSHHPGFRQPGALIDTIKVRFISSAPNQKTLKCNNGNVMYPEAAIKKKTGTATATSVVPGAPAYVVFLVIRSIATINRHNNIYVQTPSKCDY